MQVVAPQPCFLRPPDSMARAPSRASSRGESPSSIISEAREFVGACSGATPLPRRQLSLDRRPSLDASKRPFKSERRPDSAASPCASRNNSASPDRAPPKKLPSLTNLDNRRCAEASSGSSGGHSRGGSRRRNGQHCSRDGDMNSVPSMSSVQSAPARGQGQVRDPLTSLLIRDPPMTEPHRQSRNIHQQPLLSEWFAQDTRDVHGKRAVLEWEGGSRGCGTPANPKGLTRAVSSPQLSSTPGEGPSSASGLRRPPQAPKQKTQKVLRETPCADAEGLSMLKSKSTTSTDDRQQRLHRRHGSRGRRESSRRRSETDEIENLALPGQVSPTDGYPADATSPITSPVAPKESCRRRRGASCGADGADDSKALPAGPAPTDNAVAGVAAMEPVGKAAEEATVNVAAAASTSNGFSMSGMLCNDAWDAEDSICQSHMPSARGHGASNLSVVKGPRGIMSISMGPPPLDEENSFKSPHAASGSLNETLSSPYALKGSGISWVKGEVLGHGQLGSVYRALDQKTGGMFAVKEVRIDRKLDSDLKFQAALENEISIYKELSHPHIVSYLGHDQLDGHLYIYLEYMAGGSVAHVLSQFGPLDEALIATYSRELLEGLTYLHTRQPVVLHRDIKGANILVGLDRKVKLSDFGCSKRTGDTMAQSLRGSIPWMAPEVINQTGYGRRSDVWSLGCVVIEMATAKTPWGSFDNQFAAMVKISMSEATPPMPEHLSRTARAFISQCTQRDRNLRPHASDLLQHDFVSSTVSEVTVSSP
mmetsp:Transcript_32928/g.83217  ORF Transcript_32928/g.83217 Transcript_32928/m.83217 type:complete len:765 (-) Transcript_32928:97-2391(-)